MKNILEKIKSEFSEELKKIHSLEALADLETKFFGRKSGKITDAMKNLKNATQEEKRELGEKLNNLKKEIEKELTTKKDELEKQRLNKLAEDENLDITQPNLFKKDEGSFHPVTIIMKNLEELFASMGFMVLDGPELESVYYNFEALNIPEDHPARDSQDTFYIKNHPDWLMRTHTSSVQVRAMQKYGAPLRMIVPGRCFRNEATDARHEHTFHQLEGVVIDKGINFSHLKAVLETVAKHLYGEETEVRLRPKFYPFVEPGVNGEVSCFLCKGTGCRVCKKTGWLEVFGAGMIHPNVLASGGIDTKVYSGFAFGFGLTRLAMLKYMIEDIRLTMSGDLKFLKQF